MNLFKRSMFNNIFNKQDNVPDNTNYTNFKMLNSIENVFTNYDGDAYSQEIVRSCIDVIAKNTAKLKINHIRKINNKIVNQNSSIDSIFLRPNPYMSQFDFIYKIISNLYSYNNAFVYIASVNGNITGLYPVLYSSLQLKEFNNMLYCQFYFADGQRVTVPYMDLIHLRKYFNRHDLMGESNVKPLGYLMNLLLPIQDALINACKNSAKLRGILAFSNTIRPDDLATAVQVFTDQYTNAKKGAGIAGVDKTKADFIPLNPDIKNADYEQMEYVRQEVYRYFGVNEKILKSDFDENTWDAFYTNVIEPLAIQLSQEFTSKLFTEREKGYGNEILFTANKLMYASNTTKTAMIKDLMPLGLMSINEAREILNYEPVEGGDKRQVSLNYVNADKQDKYQVGEETQQGVSQDGSNTTEATV